jgi:tricorn protease
VENPVLLETGESRSPAGRAAARKAAAKGKNAGGTAGADSIPKRVPGDFGRAVSLLPAPAGPDRIALTNQRQELLVVDLPSGRVRLIERSPFARIAGIAWSPDGRWLAYGFPSSPRTCAIHLCDVQTGEVTQITRPDFYDVQPAFDPEGKYLYFISFRIFDPIYDNLYFDLGFPKGTKPFLVTLRKDIVSPFLTASRAPRAPGASGGEVKPNGASREAEKKDEPSRPVRVEIDLEGIDQRVVAFPVAEGVYGRIAGAKNRALFSSFPVEGSLEMTWASMGEPPAKGSLLVYNFEEDRTDTVSDKITDFTLSMDSKALGIRSGNRVRVVGATYKPEGKAVKDEAGRESGWCDLDRLRVSVIPGDEWRQMFREAWRLQRDQFWVPDMSGIDWKGVHDRYLTLVDRVASRAEFSDLLWEMQGELGTSHCYELGGDYRPEPTWFQGFLGADLALDPKTGVWRVARIPRGDSWDEKRSSPLLAPGINVRPGDQILEVAGLPVGRAASPYERLVHYAGREVVLKVRSGGRGSQGSTARVLAVKALKEETSLRYRDWVEANREWVHQHSKGRVGYVHVPNMGPLGYSEFHRYYLSEVYNDGLIVDVRFNGGGHVSQLLLEKLIRRRVGYDANRWGMPEPYPADSPAGPMVALTNEYAGSDGDIFSHTFKLFKLGPLIGKRTWGGVVGIWPRHSLVDGTVTTQPEFAFWFVDVGWGVENYGTEPDIEVEFRPQDYAAGRDPQLERGLAEAEKLMRRHKPLALDMKSRPRLGPSRGAVPAPAPATKPAGRPANKPAIQPVRKPARKPARGAVAARPLAKRASPRRGQRGGRKRQSGRKG